jgi:hypothetical protein
MLGAPVGGILVDKGERYLGSFALGAAKGYYGDRFHIKGYSPDLWGGVALLLGSAIAGAVSGGRSTLAPHLERFGDVGIQSALLSYGASWGASKAGGGRKVIGAGRSVVGALPPVTGGAYLSADDIARYAARR